MSGRFPEAPWEREWREYEESRMDRPKRESYPDEERKKLAFMPEPVVDYLRINTAVRQPDITEEKREDLCNQLVTKLGSFSPFEMQSLTDFITWRHERLNPDRGRARVNWNAGDKFPR